MPCLCLTKKRYGGLAYACNLRDPWSCPRSQTSLKPKGFLSDVSFLPLFFPPPWHEIIDVSHELSTISCSLVSLLATTTNTKAKPPSEGGTGNFEAKGLEAIRSELPAFSDVPHWSLERMVAHLEMFCLHVLSLLFLFESWYYDILWKCTVVFIHTFLIHVLFVVKVCQCHILFLLFASCLCHFLGCVRFFPGPRPWPVPNGK